MSEVTFIYIYIYKYITSWVSPWLSCSSTFASHSALNMSPCHGWQVLVVPALTASLISSPTAQLRSLYASHTGSSPIPGARGASGLSTCSYFFRKGSPKCSPCPTGPPSCFCQVFVRAESCSLERLSVGALHAAHTPPWVSLHPCAFIFLLRYSLQRFICLHTPGSRKEKALIRGRH